MSRAPYSQEISRQNKACFLFLLDQSFSMEEPLGSSQNRKCDELVTAINGWLQNMAIRASGDEGIKDWMDVGVFGYRTDRTANPIIESQLRLAGRNLVSISEIGSNPARIDTRNQYIPDEETGEMIQIPCEMPIWVDPVTEGGTPMCHMLYQAHEILSGWIAQHPRSFPPIVVHITDGESQDGDPTPYADAIKRLATEDGSVLLFNCHLSMTAADPFMFPSSSEGLPDHLAQVLFQMSSELPDPFFRHATAEGFPLQPGARGMAFNADMVCLIQFLNMGTQAAPRTALTKAEMAEPSPYLGQAMPAGAGPAGVVVFLVDESAGMDARIAGGTKSKAESVATALNSLLNQLTAAPPIDVALVGYRAGPDGQPDVGSRWSGSLSGQRFVSTSRLAASPLAIESRTRKVPLPGGATRDEPIQFPVWYRPTLGGPAPRVRALEGCLPLVTEWLAATGGYARPPLLVHLLGDLAVQEPMAQPLGQLQRLGTPAGATIVIHAHLGASTRIPPTLYPTDDLHLPPGAVRDLFLSASILPPPLAAALAQSQVAVHAGARGLIFNVPLTDLIRFLSMVKTYAAWSPPISPPSTVGRTIAAQPLAEELLTSVPADVGDMPAREGGTLADTLPVPPAAVAAVTPTTVPASKPASQPQPAGSPSLVVVVLDRSLEQPGQPVAKNAWSRLQEQANELLGQIAKRGKGNIDVITIAYGTDASGQPLLEPAWTGMLAGRTWVGDEELAASPLRIDELTEQISNGIGGLVSLKRKRPVYIELLPMAAAHPLSAFSAATELIICWKQDHPASTVPAIVLHLTRGRFPPAAIEQATSRLREAAEAGPVVLAHVVQTEWPHRSLMYPADMSKIETAELAKLWELSSLLPASPKLAAARPALSPQSRAFVVNGKFDMLMECIAEKSG